MLYLKGKKSLKFCCIFLVGLVDLWNIIEAFRENGLNLLDQTTEVNVSRLETLLASIFNQLNKRLPSTQQINVAHSVSVTLNWMLSAYER